MIDSIFNLIFRCSHQRLTRPLTPMDAFGAPQGDSYVLCLECGARFAYDTREMRMGRRISEPEAEIAGL